MFLENDKLTCDFLLWVVIVTRCQQSSKDESRNKYLLCLVFHNRNTFAIVPDTDQIVFPVRKTSIFYEIYAQSYMQEVFSCSVVQGPENREESENPFTPADLRESK